VPQRPPATLERPVAAVFPHTREGPTGAGASLGPDQADAVDALRRRATVFVAHSGTGKIAVYDISSTCETA
jgi:hypothetical protein